MKLLDFKRNPKGTPLQNVRKSRNSEEGESAFPLKEFLASPGKCLKAFPQGAEDAFLAYGCYAHCAFRKNDTARTLWPSGLRRWLKAPFRKGVGSNPTGVIC